MSSEPKILVTGGAGFIGSHTVVQLVEAGYEPVILDNFSNSHPSVVKNIEKIVQREIKTYTSDCNSYHDLERLFQAEKDIKGIIHFAAFKAVGESVKEPSKYYKNNLGSLMKLLEMMPEYGIQDLVFSSSCTVYGEPDRLPVDESFPIKAANSPYGNTKQICEEMIRDSVAAKNNLKAVALRYFNPVGAHPSSLIGELPIGTPANLIPFITQTAAGTRKKLTVFGDNYDTIDGSCVRDYIHVVDLANAHIKSFAYLNKQKTSNFYDVINVGTGTGTSVLQMIDAFKKVTGVDLPYEVGPKRDGDVEKIYAKVDKSLSALGWKAKYTMEDALRHAWEWEKAIQEKASNSL